MRALSLFVLLAAAASAQPAPEPGRIVGVVTDAETGDPLIAANVWLVDTQWGAATDVRGRYAVEDVPPGTYDVRISYAGYQSLDTVVSVVAPGATTTRDAALQPALFLTVCDLCWERPLLARGPYAARVVTYVEERGLCTPLYPGDSYAVDR